MKVLTFLFVTHTYTLYIIFQNLGNNNKKKTQATMNKYIKIIKYIIKMKRKKC